jgi:transposase
MKAKLSLSETERTEVRQGKANARSLTRAWIVLKLADGWDEAKVTETFAVTRATVKNVAHRFAEGGLELVLQDKVQQRRRQALTGPLSLTYFG